MMRYLGIDYGAKRIGLALSDEGGKIAFPKEIIENNLETIERIHKVLKEKNVGAIVIGESINARGEPNEIASAVNAFSEEIGKKFQLPVHKEKEFFTSVEARRYSGGGAVDHSAAALILQRYLDKISK